MLTHSASGVSPYVEELGFDVETQIHRLGGPLNVEAP